MKLTAFAENFRVKLYELWTEHKYVIKQGIYISTLGIKEIGAWAWTFTCNCKAHAPLHRNTHKCQASLKEQAVHALATT